MTSTAATATEIRPFTVNVPEDKLIDLRRRITATQWPEKETVVDQSQGVQLEVMQDLARYWATGYDWRRCEKALNALHRYLVLRRDSGDETSAGPRVIVMAEAGVRPDRGWVGDRWRPGWRQSRQHPPSSRG